MNYQKTVEFELTSEERKAIMVVERILREIRDEMGKNEYAIVNASNPYAVPYSNKFDLREIYRIGQILVMLRDCIDIEVRGKSHGEVEESE